MTDTGQGGASVFPVLKRRFRCLPSPRAIDELRIERGSLIDYKRLARFHYKSAHPGAPTTVYRLMHQAPTVVGRYLGRPAEHTVVGVLVRALPHLSCRLRNLALGDRYAGLSHHDGAAMLNREFRTLTRTVVLPQWRGLGLAVRLVRHALANPETIFTDGFAAMGRVHPFLERAGMKRYDRPPRPDQARLIDALDHLGIDPVQLASADLVNRQLAQRTEAERAWLRAELCRWHRTVNRTARDRLVHLTLAELLADARRKLLSQPIYYLFDHRHQSQG